MSERLTDPNVTYYSADEWANPEKLNFAFVLMNAFGKRLQAYENIGTIDTLTRLQRDYSDLRNEMCNLCGKYKRAHLGDCKMCRWREKGEGG